MSLRWRHIRRTLKTMQPQSRQRRSSHRHTTKSGLRSIGSLHESEKSEDNLTSPPFLGSLHGVMRGGASPFLGSLHGVMNGDRPDTDERGSEPPGGKDVAVCGSGSSAVCARGTTVEGCIAHLGVHYSIGNRLSRSLVVIYCYTWTVP